MWASIRRGIPTSPRSVRISGWTPEPSISRPILPTPRRSVSDCTEGGRRGDVDQPHSHPYIGPQHSELERRQMPWDNNTGGCGRNNGGGPWGQAPQGGGGPKRGGTPRLEDILNRGRDQFRGT